MNTNPCVALALVALIVLAGCTGLSGEQDADAATATPIVETPSVPTGTFLVSSAD